MRIPAFPVASIPAASMLAIALLSGCGSDSGNGGANNSLPLTSGIKGTALLHVSGGPPNVNGQPAVDRRSPYPGAILTLQSASGAEIARQTADAQGNFQIAIAPGTYRLAPLLPAGVQSNNGIFPQNSVQSVTVSAAQFTPVTVEYEEPVP